MLTALVERLIQRRRGTRRRRRQTTPGRVLRGRRLLVGAAVRTADAIDRVQGREQHHDRGGHQPSHRLIIPRLSRFAYTSRSENPLATPAVTCHTGITSIQIPSAPIATPIVWPKRRGDSPSSIRSPTMVPMRTPTVATMMGAQSVSSTGPECQR